MNHAELTLERLKKLYADKGISLIKKEESKFANLLGYLAALVPGVGRVKFMKRFSTIIGSKVYLAEGFEHRSPESQLVTLAHEYTHWCDFQERGPWKCGWMYAMPQVLAPLGLLGLLYPPLYIIFILALPLPSSGRMFLEMRGYTTSMWVRHKLGYKVKPEHIDRYTKYFTSGSYYWMWPFEKEIREQLKWNLMLIEQNSRHPDLDYPSLRDLEDVFSNKH